jgi:hypothetical protein
MMTCGRYLPNTLAAIDDWLTKNGLHPSQQRESALAT